MTLRFDIEKSWKPLVVPLRPSSDPAMRRSIKVWDSDLIGVRVSDEADEWFNRMAHWQPPGAAPESANAAARRFQLVSIVSEREHERPLPEEFDFTRASDKIQSGFSDAFPFLLTNEASLHSLNKQWCEPAGRTVEMAAFRPNIVVAGAEAGPWAEDHWRSIEIGGASAEEGEKKPACRFFVAKPCGRCVLTTIVPGTGLRHPTGEPLLSLREHRMIFKGREEAVGENVESAVFGQNLVQMQPSGSVRVGDAVRVTDTKRDTIEFVPGKQPAKKTE